MVLSLIVSLAVALVLIQVAVFSTTIFLHRCATHRALLLHPAVSWCFRLALWLTTGISTKEWVAVHRKHHAFTDQEGDPHSPAIMGFWSVQLGNVFHYVKEAKNPAVVERYARDIEQDWWDRTFFNRGLLGLAVGLVMLCAVLGIGWGLSPRASTPSSTCSCCHRRSTGCATPWIQELRQHRDEPAVPGAADRRRGPAQQSPRISAQPEVQFPHE